MPGKIINALKKCGSANPVVLLDEVDKLSQDFRGDPTSALLEVLDPEQNATFVDHYLDIDFDLSKVMFMATANSLHTISKPLLDRMEVIRLVGYTEEEKLAIAKQYLVPKQLKTNGLANSNVTVSPAAVKELVRYYTRESGVRNLEREIGAVLRKLARKHLEKHHLGDTSESSDASGDVEVTEEVVETAPPKKKKGSAAAEAPAPQAAATGLIDLNITETVTEKSVQKYLGPRRFRIGLTNQHHEVGLCTGLAWTEVGGDLLVAEVSILPGKGKLTCTGKLGEVMQESAQAALSYVRSRSSFLSLDDDFYAKVDIHIHVPEGAIPKDGPSAGIAKMWR
jgi:ATP-dependent Lon protease